MRLLVVNEYAVPSTAPGITRNAAFGRLMRSHGVSTTIINSDQHYWNLRLDPARNDELEPSFLSAKGAPVVTNGVGRVLRMAIFAIRALWIGMRADRHDIVLGSTPHLFAGLSAWIISRRQRSPFVLEVRDLWPESLIHLLGMSRRHPLIVILRSIERFLYRRADLVITLLPGSEAYIRQVAGTDVHVVCIPNGIDASSLTPVVPITTEPFVAMYAGAHGVANNLEIILDAAELLTTMVKGDREVRFELLGDGKHKPKLVAEARKRGLSSVRFSESVPKAQVADRLACASIVLLPGMDTTLYRYGISPNKLFDYLASGRPVVFGLKTPCDPIETSGAGWTVPPDDAAALAGAIVEAVDLSPRELMTIGMKGREYVLAHHDLNRLAATYARELFNLTRGRP